MTTRRALVTGCVGFIGRHAVQRLLADGWDVDGFDTRANVGRFERNNRGYVERVWRADARDWFRRSSEGYGMLTDPYDLVIHAAADVGGRVKIEQEPLEIAVNLAIDAEFFRWVAWAQPTHVVYVSSSAAYPIGRQTGDPPQQLREDAISLGVDYLLGTPDRSYGWSKLTGEMLAQHARAAGANVHVIRPFSGYGEDQDLNYPFPAFISRLASRQDPFTIWGDGTQVRDWVHVDDIIATMLALVEQDHPGPMNVGWGRPTSFINLARLMHDIAGVPLPEFAFEADKPRGVAYRVAEPTRLLMLRPPKITLEEGIRRAISE